MFRRVTGWEFHHSMRNFKLPKYIQAYYGETGLYNYFESMGRSCGFTYRRHFTQLLNKAKVVSPLKLNSPLQTIFVIIIIGQSFSSFLFFWERFRFAEKIRNYLQNLRTFVIIYGFQLSSLFNLYKTLAKTNIVPIFNRKDYVTVLNRSSSTPTSVQKKTLLVGSKLVSL